MYEYHVDDTDLPSHLRSAESKVEAIVASSMSPEEAAKAAEARASGDPQIVAAQAAADAQAAAAKYSAFVQGAADAQTIVARGPLNTWAILERDLMNKAADDAQLELSQANANAQSARLDAQEDTMRRMQEAHAQELEAHRTVIRALCSRLGVQVPEGF